MKAFHKPSFLSNSNIYEVNLRQYSAEGSINSFKLHLPRLKAMGVDILWFMPIHPIGSRNRKGSLGSYYSIKDFKEINREFGTKQDFAEMVNMIHTLDMKIIIDWVANHTAWDNIWTLSHPEFFVRNADGNFTSPFDWTDVIQIDHTNAAEQNEMISCMEYWISTFNIDGFRADLAHLTPLSFWKSARRRLDAVKEGLIWLAETEEPSYHAAFDISYTWKWMHATEACVKQKKDIHILKELLHQSSIDFPHALRMYFTSNHDENSWNGTEGEKYGIYAKALAVFSCTYINAVPLIYSGQELPNNKRLKFFDKDQIDWDEGITLGTFYKTLLDHRKRVHATEADFNLIKTETQLIAYTYGRSQNNCVVALNLSDEYIRTSVCVNIKGKVRDIFTNDEQAADASIEISLAPGGFIVLEAVTDNLSD